MYRPELIPGDLVTDLPHVVTLGERSIVIEYLRDTQLHLVAKIIQEAAEQGYNVGTDEFTYDGQNYSMMLQLWNLFSVRISDEEAIIGLIAISPSTYYRGWMPTYGLFNIFFTRTLFSMHHDLYSILVNEAELLSRVIFPEHLGISTSVFAVHSDWLQQLSGRGYTFSACIPLAGQVKNLIDVESYLMSKTYVDRDSCSIDILTKVKKGTDFFKKALRFLDIDEQPPQIGSFPKTVFIPQLDSKGTFKNATAADCPKIWEILRQDMSLGNGYGIDEFPCVETFTMAFHDGYNIMLEGTSCDDFIAYLSIRPQFPRRQKTPKLANTSVIIHPAYRGQRLYKTLNFYLIAFLNECGYKGILADAFVSNIAMQEGQRKEGYVRVGVVPFAGCLAEQGLSHSVLSFFRIDNDTASKL